MQTFGVSSVSLISIKDWQCPLFLIWNLLAGWLSYIIGMQPSQTRPRCCSKICTFVSLSSLPPSAPSFPSLTTSGIDPVHRSEIDEAFPAAKYTCPFGEEKHSAVSLRVQSRKNRRTPVNIVEMPRPKSRPRRDTVSAASVPPTPSTG